MLCLIRASKTSKLESFGHVKGALVFKVLTLKILLRQGKLIGR